MLDLMGSGGAGGGGGGVMELGADDSNNTENGTMNLIITKKHEKHVQMTESPYKLASCFFKGITACLWSSVHRL